MEFFLDERIRDFTTRQWMLASADSVPVAEVMGGNRCPYETDAPLRLTFAPRNCLIS